jgi:allantoinase
MALRKHGRYDYHALRGRTPYDWPNGTRLAVYLGLNLEHFAFGEGLGAELVPGGSQPDVLNHSWRDYGNRVGAWRILDLFEALALPSCVLVNAALYDYAPQLPTAFRARGDEIVAHGRSNSERQGSLDEAQEAKLIAETTATVIAHEGTRPRGWLGPWISQSHATPDLLQEAGYEYLLDWFMRTRAGRILAVPYPQEINDVPAIVTRKMNADDFAEMIIDNFDEMLEQAADTPLVMGIALHAYIVGQPFRVRHLRRALQHVARHRDRIWLTTPGAIADHVRALPEGIVPGPGAPSCGER